MFQDAKRNVISLPVWWPHDLVNQLSDIVGHCDLLIEITENGTEYASQTHRPCQHGRPMRALFPRQDMIRYYVSNWKNHHDPNRREFSFDNDPENALPSDTREKAERFRLALNRAAIEVPLLKGGTHVCSGFQVEERPSRDFPSKRFVVYCWVPSAIRGNAPEESPPF